MRLTTWLRQLIKRRGALGILIAGCVLLPGALWRRRSGRTLLLAVPGLLACLLLFRSHGPHAEPLRVTFLDVGKGDAIVIETPRGTTLVVDTGGALRDGDDQARRTILPYLQSRGKREIVGLLLTHPHPDHVGGAATLIERLPVGMLLDNGVDSTLPEYRRYRDAARARNVKCYEMRRGTTLETSDGVCLRALAPPRTLAVGRVNNTSIVLRLEYGRTAFLLTGDAETESEAEMLQSGQPLACDVLKVGHHGSKQSSSAEFVAAVKPRIAVISVDANNRNGYPAPEVLERLERAGATIYRTDRHGTITCTSDGNQVRVQTARR
jgi:competence protein ComEC